MSKKTFYYAVHRGAVPGVYTSWDEASALVVGYSRPMYKKFVRLRDAEYYMAHGRVPNAPPDRSDVDRFGVELPNVVECIHVYTDGACSNNGKGDRARGGVGVWFGRDDDPRNVCEPLDKYTPLPHTNQKAELLAASLAMSRILESPDDSRPIILYTDSLYTMHCMRKWLRVWVSNGFRKTTGQPVANQPILRIIHEQQQALGDRLEVRYVKAHVGVVGNERADRLARKGIRLNKI